MEYPLANNVPSNLAALSTEINRWVAIFWSGNKRARCYAKQHPDGPRQSQSGSVQGCQVLVTEKAKLCSVPRKNFGFYSRL